MNDFVKDIISNGGNVYLVGGAVRNIFYNKIHNENKPIKDRDILVEKMKNEQLKTILAKYGNIKEAGQMFGVIKFKIFGTHEEIDVALPRKEVSTGSGYKDFKVTIDPETIFVGDDLSRRDATINAMVVQIYSTQDMYKKDYDEKNLIDLFDGINDIKNLVWRAVGNADIRFLEDPTRMMRAIRQCAELNLKLEEKTQKSIINNYKLLDIIIKQAPVRITEEIVRTLQAINCYPQIEFIFNSKIGEYIDLKYSDTILTALKYANDMKMQLHIKVAILLMNSNISEWIKKYELSASPHFEKQYVNFIICVDKLYYDLLKCNNEIKFRNLMQEIDKLCPNKCHEFTLNLIEYHEAIQLSTNKILREYLDKNKNRPLNTSEILLDGNMIQTKFKMKGRQIGELKKWLLKEITKDRVVNKTEELINHVSFFYLNK